MKRPLIFICSPYRGDVDANIHNAHRYCRFALIHSGIPFAPHLLFTQFLNDDDPPERDAWLSLGLEMLARCDELWAFGMPTEGMKMEMLEAQRLGVPVRRFTDSCEEMIHDE